MKTELSPEVIRLLAVGACRQAAKNDAEGGTASGLPIDLGSEVLDNSGEETSVYQALIWYNEEANK